MRKYLNHEKVHPQAMSAINNFHTSIVNEVEHAVQKNEWVVVGMKQNPVVTKARKLLDAKGIK